MRFQDYTGKQYELLPADEWDFRKVPDAELKAALVWEAARENELLTRDPSRLESLPSSPAIDWLLELRRIFRSQLFGSDFLTGPWMRVSLECRYRLHQKIQEVHDGGYHCWLSHREVDESIQVYGDLEPGGERRGREKATQWRAWLRKIGVRRLRGAGLTFGQIAKLYQHVGIVGLDWAPVDEKRPEPAATTFEQVIKRDATLAKKLSLKRVIQRDAAEANRILRALLPAVFALGQAEKTGTSKFRATGIQVYVPTIPTPKSGGTIGDAMIELWMDDNKTVRETLPVRQNAQQQRRRFSLSL
jgi:hypothetical protein